MYSGKLKIVICVFALVRAAYCLLPAKRIIMLEEPTEIEKEYFYARAEATSSGTASDTLLSKTPTQLIEICNSLKNTKIYHRLYLPYPSPIPQPGNVNEVPERSENKGDIVQGLSYAHRPLKTSALETTKEERVPVFPCQTHESTTFWLTYGFAPNILFVLEEVDEGQAVSFVGQSTPLPDTDKTYSLGDRLDAFYFYLAGPGFHHSKPEAPYPFVDSVLFRLCCLTHAAREDGQEKEESFTINYANYDANAPSKRYSIESHNPSSWVEISVKAVGCAINPKDADDFEFYLRDTPTVPKAAFGLDPVGIYGGLKVLRVKQLFIDLFVPLESAFGILAENL